MLKRRAWVNERINQIDRAAEDWSSAVNMEPVDPDLYGSRGFFYLRQHRYDDALARTWDGRSSRMRMGR
jgi:hypothetical protein